MKLNFTLSHRRAVDFLLQIALLLGVFSGCSDSGNKTVVPVDETYIETGDYNAIKSHGVLRVLRPLMLLQQSEFPRSGMPLDYQSELVKGFADAENLRLEWISVDDYSDLIPALQAGKGDIIVANMTATDSRRKEMGFSLPVDVVREKLVVNSKLGVTELSQLKGRTIAVKQASSYWDTAQDLVKHFPHIKLVPVDEKLSYSELLEQVAEGKYAATILDSNALNSFALDESKLSSPLILAKGREIAWGMRSNASELRQRVNTWLQTMRIENDNDSIHVDDFDAIVKRKVLRVLTRNNAATYYLWRGELMGFEYDLMKKFASEHKLRLEMIVVPDRQQLWSWLKQGKGDVIAASITRRQVPGFSFTEPYNIVNEVVVGRNEGGSVPRNLKSLAGREIVVRPGSSYWQRIKKLQGDGLDIKLHAAPESMETEEIIDNVAKGQFDLTVADSHILDIELAWRQDIESGVTLRSGLEHGWVVRDSNPELLKALNEFVKSTYRGMFYNITRDKYFKHAGTIAKHMEQRVDGINKGKLSPYDSIVKTAADQWGFDWRMITSQMYQESRFNPHAKSNVGALGLLQVLPHTAKEFGIKRLSEPKQGIEAGVRYLDWLRRRFDNGLPLEQRIWFVLAAYNAGFGHVQDARRLAIKKGWDSNRWFDNVEKSMLLLSQRQYASQSNYGYVRGREPVNYVRQIRDRYQAYVRLTNSPSVQ